MMKTGQNIVFRADASTVLATGHIMRCLTLAQALQRVFINARIIFICNKLPVNLSEKIAESRFELITLPFDIDSKSWQQLDDANASISQLLPLLSPKEKICTPLIDLLIIDHYLIDFQWQKKLNKYCKKLLVIDDLANRKHQADFLLDQTLARKPEDYRSLVPPYCQLLLGQHFMLLRDEFSQLIHKAKTKRNNTKTINNILVNLGGVDSNNVSATVIRALIDYQDKSTQDNVSVEVVMTSHSPHLAKIQNEVAHIHWIKVIVDCDDMARKMLAADLAIGACGATAWERCCLGLPTLAIVLADNQKVVCENLAHKGAIINLGDFAQLTTAAISNALDVFKNQPEIYSTMVDNCFTCCDGLGVKNVLSRLTSSEVSLIPATKEDLDITFKWQSTESIRRYSRQPKPVEYQEHSQWFLSSLTMNTRHIFMIAFENEKLGVLRLDQLASSDNTARFEISILVAPQAQGKKIALKAIHAIPNTFDNSEIYAHVHRENKASQRLFQQANFNKIAQDSYIRPAYTGLFTHE